MDMTVCLAQLMFRVCSPQLNSSGLHQIKTLSEYAVTFILKYIKSCVMLTAAVLQSVGLL